LVKENDARYDWYTAYAKGDEYAPEMRSHRGVIPELLPVKRSVKKQHPQAPEKRDQEEKYQGKGNELAGKKCWQDYKEKKQF
jgi:hypothetical protein